MLQVHITHNIIVVPGGVGVTGTQLSQHHCGTRRSGCYRYTALITSLWYQEEWVLQIHSTNNIIVVPGGVGITGRISHIFHTVTFLYVTKFIQ